MYMQTLSKCFYICKFKCITLKQCSKTKINLKKTIVREGLKLLW